MKFCFTRKKFLFIFILLIPVVSFCQQSIAENSTITAYNNALQLFNNKAYAAAQEIFLKVNNSAMNNSNLEADAAYYEAICAIRLKQPKADKKVLAFIEKYPTSNKKNKTFYNVGNYYFANKKAAYALKWYKKVNEDLISKENKKELNFKMGYGFLVTKNYSLAKNCFLPLINDAKYGNDARYYYGYISYKLEDYGIAESTLSEIADNKSYKSEISYYLLDISFKAGKFEKCVIVGKELLQTAKRKEKSEISKIIGESYFNLKQYKDAIPYLKEFKGKKGKWNNSDFYQLGYAYYKQNDFEKAVNYFNRIIDQKNNVSQNAYYHLGECYLNLDKKTEALNAFKSASEMNFDEKIKQDAALNYAKLSYEEGNPFKSVAQVLQDYLKEYPKSSAYTQINNLVVSSFIHQQDYKGALVFLSKNKSAENKETALEVALYRGIQLFNEKKLTEALPFFIKSTESSNSDITQKAKYWEAETIYRLDDYKVALSKFTTLKNSLKPIDNQFELIDYNIGYSYFKLKEYNKAIVSFKSFLQKNNLENGVESNIKNDALIRLGDSYFVTRNYAKAIKTYQEFIDKFGSGTDYAQYQIGMCYGFTNNNTKKINVLTKVVNTDQVSSLKDDALYQIAITHTALKDNKKAHLAYDRILEKHPKSIFVSKVLVRQGLLYYNDAENEKALEKFKKVASQFPNSSDAFEAVANAKNIYIDNGNLEEYVSWINTLKFVNVTNKDLDNTTFAVAEKLYFESKNSTRISTSLFKYLKNFPEGIYKLKASFYLAETLYKLKDIKNATVNYQVVLNAGQNEFSEESLNKLAQIYLEKGNFNKATPLLLRLEEEAYSTENVLFSQSNLMKGYYESEEYYAAIVYAKKILLKDKLEIDLEYDAKTIIARASFKTEDFFTAEEYYLEVGREAIGELKAETLYYNSFFKNQQKEYAASNKVVQDLIANYSAYKYWAVKSYVIMGKNYYGLEDVYQATFVLENVIKNFKQFNDIIKEAEKELNFIKVEEAKTNNSVTPTKTKIIKKENNN